MQNYGNREKDYYEVGQGQRNGYGQNQSYEGYSKRHWGSSPTTLSQWGSFHKGHWGSSPTTLPQWGSLHFKGQNGQKGQSSLGTFLGQHKTQEANKGHGHGKLLGQHQQSEHKKKKNNDGHGSGDESGSDSD